jgi:hypothetical protein
MRYCRAGRLEKRRKRAILACTFAMRRLENKMVAVLVVAFVACCRMLPHVAACRRIPPAETFGEDQHLGHLGVIP